MSQPKQTVCLNMIVRNESRIIERCLNSVKSFIDHWVIVDTGSTDGTQQLIRDCLRDLPGELIERPWVNFAHNRSEALEFAFGKSHYLLVIDADEVLVHDDDFVRPPLTHDAYYLLVRYNSITFWRIHLFRNESNVRYESPVHEYLVLPETTTYDRMNGVSIDSFRDGWRAAQPDVCQRDIELLLKALEQTPNNPRTTFYLAQSYFYAGEPASALEYYQRYVQISVWPEERWLALLQIADLKQQLQREWPEVLAAYLEAYQFRPQRAEPLYRIALQYRLQGAFHLSQLFLQKAVTIPFPHEDILFVEERLYKYLIKMALATCCYHVGDYEAGLRYCDELLENPESMPPNISPQIFLNRQQCAAKLAEKFSTSGDWQAKIKVVVAFHTFGPHLDNCVERLLAQTYVQFEVVFLDLGSTSQPEQQIPTEDPRVRLVHRSEGENVWSIVAEHCDENDIVLLLNGSDWLISDDALAKVQKCFTDPGCLVMYGQFQFADGAPGLACAIQNIESERLLTDDWRCTYPVAVRGSLLRQVASEISTPVTSPASFMSQAEGFSTEEHVALVRILFAAAGAIGVRFISAPICVHDSETTPSQNANAAFISKNTLPTISCLTVTSNRLVSLKEAIHCYCRQTYPNKELVIVTDGTPRYRQAISDYVRWLGRNDIRLVPSLDAATGTIVCQWGDDHLNHPQRLERQFEHLTTTGADGCCFTDQLQFFFRERLLYWSDWSLIASTLMAYREANIVLEQIAEQGNVTPFPDAGFLNLRSYHGQDVFTEAPQQAMAIQGSRSTEFLREHESMLRAALEHYRLPEPYSVVTGNVPLMLIVNRDA
jgi:glycosyltransferase involved in cell wall biosynthesis